MENVKLLLSQKSHLDLVEKIKYKNKNRTRASLFQSSEDGKQEKFLCGLSMPYYCWWYWRIYKRQDYANVERGLYLKIIHVNIDVLVP